jgi:hypothetical protein
MATAVVNRTKGRGGAPPFDVYIGRADRYGRWAESEWHTPYPVRAPKGPDERAESVGRFLTYLHCERPDLLARVGELRGKALGCWCLPDLCHGEVLAERADEVGEE